jgi:hypothetical protein
LDLLEARNDRWRLRLVGEGEVKLLIKRERI